MSEQTAQEPTMEEILASIRRIISEDDAPPAPSAEPEPQPEPILAAPAPAPIAPDEDDDDVLELTDTVDPMGEVETVGDLDIYTPTSRAAEPEPAWEPEPEPEPEPAFMADPAPAAAAAAFVPTGDIRIHGDMTITELVRVILEPQLKQWADENLDEIVRAVLREKLERVFR
jgi:cell pole-organizing protein PopZ